MSKRKTITAIGLAGILGGVTLVGICPGRAALSLQPLPLPPPTTLPAGSVTRTFNSLDAGEFRAGTAALASGQIDAALLIFGHVIKRNPTNTDALDGLTQASIACVRDLARRDRQMEAIDVLRMAHRYVAEAQLHLDESSDPVAIIPILLKLDESLDETQSRISADVEATAKKAIAKADGWADVAHHGWYTFHFNDRTAVRSGIKELRWVHDRFDVLGEDAQGEYHRSLQNLKSLLSDREWDPMLASAGFVTKVEPTLLAQK